VTEPTSDDDSTLFVVGLPWPWRDSLIAEPSFGWHPDAGMLLMVHDNVTQEMCDDLAGPVDVSLIVHGPLIGLLCHFSGGWEWSETMAWRGPGEGFPESLAPGSGPQRMLLKAVLVDRGTKIVRHIRPFTLSPHFSRMVENEAAYRWGPDGKWPNGVTVDEALRWREEWNQRHPTMKSALKAAIARSHGGD